MIDAGNVVGLSEIGSVSATQDARELAPYQPELRASVAINPDSAIIGVNRPVGVLSTFVRPTGGDDRRPGLPDRPERLDLARDGRRGPSSALHVNVPPTPAVEPRASGSPNIPAQFAQRFRERYEGRDKRLDELKDHFRKATAFDEVAAAARERGDVPPVDPRLEALAPYAKGEKPVVFSADDHNEILTALEIAEGLKLKAIITGGADAWKVADALKEAGVPVLVARDPAQPRPRRALRRRLRQPRPAPRGRRDLRHQLQRRRLRGPQPPLRGRDGRRLRPARGRGAEGRHPLPGPDPRRRRPARLASRSASGPTSSSPPAHLLQPTTEVKHLFIAGRPVAPESRQTELYERYRGRLAEVRAGISPLGLDRARRPACTEAEAEPAG